MENFSFRIAAREDVPTIFELIKGLAEYEKMSDQVVTSVETLEEWLFDRKCAEVMLANVDGKDVGYCLFFHNFSSFLGRAGLYVEDIFVLPEYRGNGIGKTYFKKLAQIAVDRGCGRMEWVCLDWNKPSIDLYKSLGAIPQEEWIIFRMDGQTLLDMGKAD